MSWRTSRALVLLRNIGRRIGLNRLLSAFLADGGYETRYDKQLRQNVKAGDCVWDVGANVGLYTAAFAECVGPSGSVCAFEPSPINFAKLEDRCKVLPNVRLFRIGLGDSDGELFIQQGADELGATSRVERHGSSSERIIVKSGDSLLRDAAVPRPQAIKIDVEGYEIEVVSGLAGILKDAGVHLIGIEIHFGILNERGLADAPRQIEHQLQECGFTVSWPDASHILGTRSR